MTASTQAARAPARRRFPRPAEWLARWRHHKEELQALEALQEIPEHLRYDVGLDGGIRLGRGAGSGRHGPSPVKISNPGAFFR